MTTITEIFQAVEAKLTVVQGAVFHSLPDDGPWGFTVFNGKLILASKASGVYVIEDGKLAPVTPVLGAEESAF